MPRHSEPSVNVILGETLGRLLPSFKVWAEDTSIFVKNPALQPDVMAVGPGTSPVVIEAEYMPARNVETEANSRLDLLTTVAPRPVESVIALRYPLEVRVAEDLRATIESADLSYCVFSQGSETIERFPASGWLWGSVGDLADMVRLVSVPQRAVDEAAAAFERGIDQASSTLNPAELVFEEEFGWMDGRIYLTKMVLADVYLGERECDPGRILSFAGSERIQEYVCRIP